MYPDADPAPAMTPVPGPPSTDRELVVDRVEQAVQSLSGLDALPVAEHVARFDAMHAALTEALSSIDRV